MGTRYHGSACKTCRRRGRKCTRELPHCRSCTDKGIDCEGYPLKWAGLASRGTLAGAQAFNVVVAEPKQRNKSASNVARRRETRRSKPTKSTSPETNTQESNSAGSPVGGDTIQWSPSVFENAALLFPETTFEADFDIEALEVEDEEEVIDEMFTTDEQVEVLPLVISGSLNSFLLPPELKFILNYHLHEVAPKLCVDNNAMRNPYREYIYPLAVQKPPLLYACAALASAHFSARQNDQSFMVEALRLRGKAMRRLQEFIWCEQTAVDESNLATILMLTLCDMSIGAHSNFETYFTFAKRLVDLRGANRTQDNFVEQYIAWLDIMSSASTSRQSVFTSKDIVCLRGASSTWSRDVIPCPTDLFEILLEIVETFKSGERQSQQDINLPSKIASFKNRVLTCVPHFERGMPWYHLTEAYRHAILLYMARLFKLQTDVDEIAWLVQSIIYHSKSTPTSSGWSDQLLWPLFHAGLEVGDDRRRQWLRERFTEMQLSGGFRNVATAMDALENVWNGQNCEDYTDLLVKEGLGDMLVI